jgi:hypothetical protein
MVPCSDPSALADPTSELQDLPLQDLYQRAKALIYGSENLLANLLAELLGPDLLCMTTARG